MSILNDKINFPFFVYQSQHEDNYQHIFFVFAIFYFIFAILILMHANISQQNLWIFAGPLKVEMHLHFSVCCLSHHISACDQPISIVMMSLCWGSRMTRRILLTYLKMLLVSKELHFRIVHTYRMLHQLSKLSWRFAWNTIYLYTEAFSRF